jgi:hypothetical protein
VVAAASRAARRRPGRPRWWIEAPLVVVFYELYSLARAHLDGPAAVAQHHARQIIAAERAMHAFIEKPLQEAFLHSTALVRASNVYYGLTHFVVPAIALVWLWWRAPERYRHWRTVFGAMLVLALVGFWLYPLAPPRLLPRRYGFVDTAVAAGGFGPFGRAEAHAANLYAAMPSLHIGWSTWCVVALWPVVRSPVRRAALLAYPAVTLLVVMVTANHYWLDGVGGLAALAGGVGLAHLSERASTVTSVTDSGSEHPLPDSC